MSYRGVVWTLAAISVSLLSAAELLVLVRYAHGHPPGSSMWLIGLEVLCTWVTVGVVLALRVPQNRIGLLVLVLSCFGGVQIAGWSVATAAGPAASTAMDVGAALSAAAQVCGVAGWMMVLPQLLPTGRPLSRRWAVGVWLAALGVLVTAVAQATTNAGVRQTLAAARTPWPVPAAVGTALSAVGGLLLVTGGVSGIVTLFLRWRRSAADTRQQLKWIVVAAALVAVLFVGQALLPSSLPAWGGDLLWCVIGASFPVAIAIAVLRYRLYDIDRLISRTLGYAVVTGLLIAVYLAVVTVTTRLIPSSTSFGVAASTLAAAASFAPLRRRVQRRVDHRFNRTRYDASRAVDRFAGQLRHQVDLVKVQADLINVTAATVAPAFASIWMQPPT
jgi:hypothetical protein